MSDKRKKALVVCPGRGSYNKTELGYLKRHHADKTSFIKRIDAYRDECKQPSITSLDHAETYNPNKHTRGDNAAALIYACAYADFLDIDRDQYDVIAITGNSMGWYIALACAGSLNESSAIRLINTMGSEMHQKAIGGQLIYPWVDDNWQAIPGQRRRLIELMQLIDKQDSHLDISIELGGMLVFAGHNKALDRMADRLDKHQHYPLRPPNHAAFHTSLMQSVSETGKRLLPESLFNHPNIDLIDGRGHIWRPYSSNIEKLWQYTLDSQVVQTYHFTRAIQVAVREYAPECLILLGPGNTLGSAVAQSMIEINWRGLQGKADFISTQNNMPFVLSMGLPEQREMCVTSS